jgi:hypothetical protein
MRLSSGIYSSKRDARARTGIAVRPGDFPLGSPQSRAAARARAHELELNTNTLELIFVGLGNPHPDGLVHVAPWSKNDNGGLWRTIRGPEGMSWPPDDPSKVCWNCKCGRRKNGALGETAL